MKPGKLLTNCVFSVNIKNIIDQYKAGQVSAPFTCADNSGTVG